MKEFFHNLRNRITVAMLRYEQWLDERDQARRAHHIIHRAKTEWILSGMVQNENGHRQDAGFLRSPHPMRRAQALRYFRRMCPNGKIIHIDDRNKIITYSF